MSDSRIYQLLLSSYFIFSLKSINFQPKSPSTPVFSYPDFPYKFNTFYAFLYISIFLPEVDGLFFTFPLKSGVLRFKIDVFPFSTAEIPSISKELRSTDFFKTFSYLSVFLLFFTKKSASVSGTFLFPSSHKISNIPKPCEFLLPRPV